MKRGVIKRYYHLAQIGEVTERKDISLLKTDDSYGITFYWDKDHYKSMTIWESGDTGLVTNIYFNYNITSVTVDSAQADALQMIKNLFSILEVEVW